MSNFLKAIVAGTSFMIVVAVAFTVFARPLSVMLGAFNSTMADFTGMTGDAWNSYNPLNRSILNLWFPIGAGLIIFAIVYIILNAQRKEYVTGDYRI